MQNVNFGNVGSGSFEVSLLAAALVMVLGIWRGRRDLGQRAALGVLATIVGISLLLFSGSLLAVRFSSLVTLGFFGLLSIVVSFLPLYVAANWVEVILRDTRP